MRVERIGNAELYLGDCLEVLPTLPKVDAVITDPPYGTGGWRRSTSGAGSNPAATLVREEWDDGAVEWVGLTDAPIVSFWPSCHMGRLYAKCEATGRTKFRMLVMRKLDPKPQVGGRIAWSIEPIVVASRDGFQLYGGTDYCEASAPRLNRDSDATGHPYQKPLGVLEWLVGKVRADSILDPFMGSGTTGVACVNLGRKFIGVEIDERYFQIACERIDAAQRQQRLFA